MATKKAKTPAAGASPATLRIEVQAGKSRERLLADISTEGLFTNAALLITFGKNLTGEIAITEAVQSLRATVEQVNRGELGAAETLLMSQAAALNAMFGELARRSGLNMGEHLDAADRYMRLALKAQGQCRATLETLATIKNPPVVFAKQANINNGGQQQVNNGVRSETSDSHAGAPAANQNSEPTGLLEVSDVERLDTGAAGTAGGADPHLATVGTVNGAADR